MKKLWAIVLTALFVLSMCSALAEEQITGFIFEAFDELWKGDSPAASECNFGLYDEYRRKKW